MKTMNRTVAVLLALTLLFSLSACSGLLPGKLTFNVDSRTYDCGATVCVLKAR